MLITCNGCSKKIKVPDAAAGKRVKCPQCATVIRIPAADTPEESDAAPPSEEEAAEPEKKPVGTELTTAPKSTMAGKKKVSKNTMMGQVPPEVEVDIEPPKSKKKRRDEDDEDDDEPRSKKKSLGRDDDEDDDDRRPVKKSRHDYDDEDDHVDIRRKKRRGRDKQTANGMAIASMVCGICAAVSYLAACGCGFVAGPFGSIPGGLAVVLAIVGVILGHIGKTPGSEGFALTGLITSYIVLVLTILGVILVVVLLIFGVALLAAAGANRPPQPIRRF